ncbi:MAG: hypothetical protein ACLRZH_04955 [Ruthenibacterium lactatiformans]
MLGMVTMLGWRDEAYYNSDFWRGTWKGEGGGVLVNQAPISWIRCCGTWARWTKYTAPEEPQPPLYRGGGHGCGCG